MSVVGSLEADLDLNTSAAKFLEIFSTRIYELVTVSPDFIQSIEIVQGQLGTAGFVFLAHYSLLDGMAQVSKVVVESINLTDVSMTFKVIEGDLLDVYNSFVIYLKLTPNILSVGSVLHWTSEHEKPTADTVDPTSLMEVAIRVSKDIDAYVTNLI
ncbi:MLP-like protein 28 [Prosopis cineraria]|uniref:MLP-like protein 28 n=1 Tax=Prosopis cineraria TaxID=364024 RepID=UPI00240F280A|nr:MLP-like protein 28 [Prosopis cineraria]